MSGAIVGFGEILLRLASAPPALLFQEMRLEASFCGAEANALVALAGFGHRCRMVTALPEGPVGRAAGRAVGHFGVEMALAAAPDGGRMGLFFLQPGAMTRPSAITYDRASSAFALSGPQHFDWPALLEGAQWLFVSGISAALGDGPLAALRDAMAEARARGVKIAFDTNFRPALWRGREDQAAGILRDLSCQADLLFAGRRAVAMMAGGSFDQADPDAGFHAAARRMFELAPRLSHVAATRRRVHSTDRQDLTGLLADRDGLSASRTAVLEAIVDRVGTGDAFAAGVVHGLVAGMDRARTIEFAAACAQWGHSVPGDFLRASLADIAGLMNGGGDVSR